LSYSETKGKSLEEIAIVFGDEVAFTEFVGAGVDGMPQKNTVKEQLAAQQIEHVHDRQK